MSVSVSDMFREFLDNLRVENAEQIGMRYGEITSSLNKKFRDSESKTANTLQVGSYGRYTGIKGISDLDMLYIMPKSKWDTYKNNRQSQLLTDVKDAILARYPRTNIGVDRLVVTVSYSNFHIEIQPVFEELDDDGNSYFRYPDTYNNGSWKVTKPRQEMQAVRDLNNSKNGNLRSLCKMTRAWKNKNGVSIGGLLIDTLAYNFMQSTNYFDEKSYHYFDELSRDFFRFLADQPDREHYKAPGSNQNVAVKKKFQKPAETAHELCVKAIEAKTDARAHARWRAVYGPSFPASQQLEEAKLVTKSWRDTEQYIEDLFPVDIRHSMIIDCNVYQHQSIPRRLLNMLENGFSISSNRSLIFHIAEHDIPGDFDVRWKVLNRGEEAKNRDQIRGQIEKSNNVNKTRKESASFRGDHIVECYAIQGGVVVARSSILVPIL
ncbi:MAG: nucleotidyltransferase [Pseudomonadales bacterium]|nr:nucleotidyltransferase [Pseudomonadales bacterium]